MRAWISVALCLLAFAAFGQQPANPDYSREAILRMFGPRPPENLPPGRVQWHPGYVEFRALGMSWRVAYLPLLAPLPGARLEDGAMIPNPFALSGAPYASTMPPMFDNDRSWAVRRERARIERMVRRDRRRDSR